MKKKNINKAIIFAAAVGLVCILNHIFGWSAYLKDKNNLMFLQNTVKDNLLMAGAVYVVLTVVGCVVLAIPGITFAVIAGVIFGPVLGTVLCSAATTAGAALAFLTGRFFLKDSIKPLAVKNKYLKRLLFDETGNNAVIVLMITRLVPLFPYNLQNFAYGVTDIGFWTYTVCSFLFMIPGTALFTIGAAGLTAHGEKKMYIAAVFMLVVIVFGAGYILKRRYIGDEAGIVEDIEDE